MLGMKHLHHKGRTSSNGQPDTPGLRNLSSAMAILYLQAKQKHKISVEE
jgi:hypothetical protein